MLICWLHRINHSRYISDLNHAVSGQLSSFCDYASSMPMLMAEGFCLTTSSTFKCSAIMDTSGPVSTLQACTWRQYLQADKAGLQQSSIQTLQEQAPIARCCRHTVGGKVSKTGPISMRIQAFAVGQENCHSMILLKPAQ